MFCIFEKNSKIQNGRNFWQVKYLLKLGKLVFTDTLWVKNFAEFALSGTVFKIQAIFVKNSKIQNGHHFWWDNFFFENWVKNFVEIALSSMVFEIQAFLCFGDKFANSKWPPFLASETIFAIFAKNSKWLPFLAGQNFVEIALSSMVFEIQAFLCFAFLKKIASEMPVPHSLAT